MGEAAGVCDKDWEETSDQEDILLVRIGLERADQIEPPLMMTGLETEVHLLSVGIARLPGRQGYCLLIIIII